MLLFILYCTSIKYFSYPQGSISDQQNRDVATVLTCLVVVTVRVLVNVDVVVIVVRASRFMACTVALWPRTKVFQKLHSCPKESRSHGHICTLEPAATYFGACKHKPRLCCMRPVMPSKPHCWLVRLAIQGCRWMPPPLLRYSTESTHIPCLLPITPALRSMYHCWLSFSLLPHGAMTSPGDQSMHNPCRLLTWNVMSFLPGKPEANAGSLCRMNSTWFLR
mmetsp:Transcript_71847/g.138835  ORF Transcript_71847/g.138835 Transcript_71847/m.138835 type:complete len:221 (-) Transcript_71847:196-858(-)